MRLGHGEYSAVPHEHGLVDGLTSDLPLFSERHSSASCSSLVSSALSGEERVELPPTRRGPTRKDDQVGTSSLLESGLSQCLRHLVVAGSPLLQLYRPPSTATGRCNSVGLLLFGLLHISYFIGQGSMVTKRWRTSVKDFRYHCLTQPKSSAHFSTLHASSHDILCQQSTHKDC